MKKDPVSKIIEESGNVFHMKVMKYLESFGWDVCVSQFYSDPVTGKPREIDVLANKKFLKGYIKCGNKNLEGGVVNAVGGAISFINDNGSSGVRSSFRQHTNEEHSIIIGNNKFYDYKNLLYVLEKPDYLLVVAHGYGSNFRVAPPLYLTSLKF